MESNRDKQFIPLGFSFLDHCGSKVTPTMIVVYAHIRRYVCRKDDGSVLGLLYREGTLAAGPSQDTVAEKAGLSLRTVQSTCAKLEKIKWLKKVKTGHNHRIYVLGKRVEIDEGSGEVFFAEAWTQRMIEAADKKIKVPKC